MSENPLQVQGLTPRKAAWEVIQAVGGGAFSDIALHRVLKRSSFNSIDKALITELSYGAIRQRYYLDCWIDFLGKVPSNKQPPVLRWLLHLGLYQILKMDKIPPAAAIYTTVELAKTNKLAKLAPVVNGILRSALRCKDKGSSPPRSKDPCIELAKNESLPIWLASELISWKGKKEALQIAKAFNNVRPIDLRVNILKTNLKELKKDFDLVGVKTKLILDCPNGLEVLPGFGEPASWPGYEEGKWCIQDRSSQLVAPFLKPLPGDRILDACAAPGGKSTHIAELIGNEGEVWSVDRSTARLKRLLANSVRLGTGCIRHIVADSTKLLSICPDWKGRFHRILLDAPCSGLGTLSRHPDARWRMEIENINELVMLQSQLLISLTPLLMKGGRLVYSTCTMHPNENSHQIENFLRRFPEFSLKYEKQIWPGNRISGDGFYIAVVDKLIN